MKNLKKIENIKFITIEQIQIGDIIEYSIDYRKQTLIVKNISISKNKAKIEGINPTTNTQTTLYISDTSQKEYFKIVGKTSEDQLEK